MSSTQIRIISGAVAALILFFVVYLWQAKGAFWLSTILIFLGIREGDGLFLGSLGEGRLQKNIFSLVSLTFYFAVVFFYDLALPTIVFLSFSYISFLYLTLAQKMNLESLLSLIGRALTGVLYCGALPAFVCKMLFFDKGLDLFFAILIIVFAGDTMAYIVGLTMGRKKIFPVLSPKKTVEGSLGGVLGSSFAAVLCGYYLLDSQHVFIWAGFGALLGITGQLGDFFESLLKRVAQVKDSGQIMPGHGGVLDRLDGVYFASPLFLLFVHILKQLNWL